MAGSSGFGNQLDPAPFRLTLPQSSCLTNADVQTSSLALGFCSYGQHLVTIMFRFSDEDPTPSALDFRNLKVTTSMVNGRQGHVSDMPGLQNRWPPILVSLPCDDLGPCGQDEADSTTGCDSPLPWMACPVEWCLVTPDVIC